MVLYCPTGRTEGIRLRGKPVSALYHALRYHPSHLPWIGIRKEFAGIEVIFQRRPWFHRIGSDRIGTGSKPLEGYPTPLDKKQPVNTGKERFVTSRDKELGVAFSRDDRGRNCKRDLLPPWITITMFEQG